MNEALKGSYTHLKQNTNRLIETNDTFIMKTLINHLRTLAMRSLRSAGSHAYTALQGGYQPSPVSTPKCSPTPVKAISLNQGWFKGIQQA
jgi:hypothetical protein